jgi:hypothetical protein
MAIDFSGLMAVEDVTAAYLQEDYLFGLELLDDTGNPYPDSFYEHAIIRAASKLETVCQIRLTPRTIIDEPHDYHVNDYQMFSFIKLWAAPVISVEQVRIVFPTSVEGVIFPKGWVKLDKNGGQIQLIPTAGTLSQVIMGQGGSYLPMIYHGGLSYLPQLFHIDYTSGFEEGKVPVMVISALCKLAVIDILTIVADVIYPPGMTSKSVGIDGLSESMGIMNNGQKPPVFTGRISQYEFELYGAPGQNDGLLPQIKTAMHGLNFQGM